MRLAMGKKAKGGEGSSPIFPSPAAKQSRENGPSSAVRKGAWDTHSQQHGMEEASALLSSPPFFRWLHRKEKRKKGATKPPGPLGLERGEEGSGRRQGFDNVWR